MADGVAEIVNRYFDDLRVGDRFHTGCYEMTLEDVLAFARQWDPQPLHVDSEAAAASPFGGLIASGWHTAAVVMKLTAEARPLGEVTVLGLGVERMEWPQPVRPGDVIRVEMEVTAVRPSKSRPAFGIVSLTSTAYNQRDEVVCVVKPNVWVPRRPA
jgi:acyl dehydratase